MTMRFFTQHPASVGETYGEHFVFAVGVGGRMVIGGLACMLPAFVPELCKTTRSRAAGERARRLVRANRGTPSRAASPAAPPEPLFTAAELESLTSASL